MRRTPPPSLLAFLVPAVALAQTRQASPPTSPPMSLKYTTLDGEKGSIETLRDRVVVLAFLGNGSGPEDWTKVKEAATAIAGVEAVAIFVGKDRARAEGLVRDSAWPFPVMFDEKNGADGLAKRMVATTTPWCVVLDPDGRVAARVGVPQLLPTLQRQVELTPPRTVSKAVVAVAEEKLTLAEGMLKAKKYWPAVRYLSQLPEDAPEDPAIGQRISKATLALDGKADGLIAETEAMITGGKLGEAVYKLEQLAVALKRSPVLGKVEDQLHSVTDDPDLKKKADEQRPAVVAEDEYETAVDYDERVARGKAYVQLNSLIKAWPKTPAGAAAKALLAKWESEPAERRRLRDALYGEQANSLLSRADNLRNSSFGEKARPLYEQVVKEFPYTTAAEKAAEILKAWK